MIEQSVFTCEPQHETRVDVSKKAAGRERWRQEVQGTAAADGEEKEEERKERKERNGNNREKPFCHSTKTFRQPNTRNGHDQSGQVGAGWREKSRGKGGAERSLGKGHVTQRQSRRCGVGVGGEMKQQPCDDK